MAELPQVEAPNDPPFSNSKTDIDYIDNVIMKFTIKELELPKKTLVNKKDIVDAIYKRCQNKVIKNMARISSKNSETIKKHGEFIVEQAHFNQDKMQDSAKRILILKDLDKLGIELENVNKSKQIENAQKDTEKFLLEQGIKKEEIVRIFAFSERLSTIRMEFRDEFGRNGADLKIRQTFNTHKMRTVGISVINIQEKSGLI